MPLAVITDNALHNGFPSLVVTGGTNLLLTYRVAVSHAADIGKIVKKTSTNNGDTWSAETTVLTNAAIDYRTAQMRKLSNGNILMCVAATNWPVTTPWTGFSAAYISNNNGTSWTGPYSLPSGYDGGTSQEGPPCELGDGRILLPIYGVVPGDTGNSVSIIQSSDGGVTWGNEKLVHRMAEYSASFIPWQGCSETVLVRLSNDKLIMLMRGDNDTDIYMLFSSDARRWSATRHAFRGSGKPHFIQLPNGTLRAVYRAFPGFWVVRRESYNFGGNWSEERLIDAKTHIYADSVILNDGRQLCVYATETSLTKAEIRAVAFDSV